jgi:hypothetical protein
MWSNMQFEQEIYDAEYEKIIELKNTLSAYPEDWVTSTEFDLKIGDIIYVEYCPDSQKYMYTHCPEYGTVQEIGLDEFDDKKQKISIKILNYKGQIVDLNKEHLSIYSCGYCMYIKKYELNYNKIISTN